MQRLTEQECILNVIMKIKTYKIKAYVNSIRSFYPEVTAEDTGAWCGNLSTPQGPL